MMANATPRHFVHCAKGLHEPCARGSSPLSLTLPVGPDKRTQRRADASIPYGCDALAMPASARAVMVRTWTRTRIEATEATPNGGLRQRDSDLLQANQRFEPLNC